MGAGASASSQASLFTAEQKAEIKKQVGVSTSMPVGAWHT